GIVQWAKSAGGANYDVGRGIAISGSSLYVSGNIQSTANFSGTSVTAAGVYDAFIAKYTTAGTVSWVVTGGGTGYDISNGICADGAGNAYITGYFDGTASFGNITIVNASTLYTDIFVAKINSSGTFLWAKRGGNPSDDDIGRAIDCDVAGNVYAVGEYRGTATFDNITVTNAGIADIFIAKYSSGGAIQYVSTEGSDGGDYCYAIAVSPLKVFITGLFNGIVQFGNAVLTSAGSNDIYLAQVDASTGAFDWTESAGGLGDDAGRAVAISTGGYIVYGGDFEHNGSTFNQFTLNTQGGHDIFVAKVSVTACATASVSINAGGATTFCEDESVVLTSTSSNALSFQWLLNGMAIAGATNPNFTAITSGSYVLLVTDNCDNETNSNSIIITVKKAPKAKITPTGDIEICAGDMLALAASGTNVSYQWTKNKIVIPGETNATLVVASGGNYRVTITKNSSGCSATSKPAKVKVTCKAGSDKIAAVSIFPNPSSDEFMLSGISEPAQLKITDLSGRMVETVTLQNNLSFGSFLSSGIYLVYIYSNGQLINLQKVIKE
ncbi:MAG: T9SS type A sorting domain-containing protein, partial [Chitinophagales bacterium]